YFAQASFLVYLLSFPTLRSSDLDRRRGGADRPVHFLGRVPTRAPAGGTGINCAAAHRRAAAHSPATEPATAGSHDAHDHFPGHRGPRRTERSRAVLSRAHGPVGN